MPLGLGAGIRKWGKEGPDAGYEYDGCPKMVDPLDFGTTFKKKQSQGRKPFAKKAWGRITASYVES